MKKQFKLFALLALLCGPSFAATLQLPATGTITQEVSGELTIVDPGGISGNYPNNSNTSVILIPSSTSNYLKVTFTSLTLATGDYVRVYNKPDMTSSDEIVNYTSGSTPAVLYCDHAYGLMALKFTSDAGTVNSGFVIKVEEVSSLPPLDFKVNSITPPATLIEGQYSVFTANFSNNGLLNRRVPMHAYFSFDTIIDPTDTLWLSGTSSSYFWAGRTANSSLIATELDVPAGNYYLIFKADPDNIYPEANETDNIAFIPITIQAATIDLQVTTTGSFNFIPGTPQTLSFEMYNTGNTNSGASTYAFYLSDDVVPEEDELISNPYATSGFTGTPAGAYNYCTGSVSVENLVPGNYYLLVKVDYFNTVNEINEANNVKVFPLTVIDPNLELSITIPGTFPLSTPKQVSKTVPYTLHATGNILPASAEVAYFLSADASLDPNDQPLGRETATFSSATAPMSCNIYLPDYLTLGSTYYVLVQVDPDNDYFELNETDNVQSFAVNIIPQTFDFYPQYTPAPPITGIEGKAQTIPVNQLNGGNYTPTSACMPFFRVYFSTDTLVDVGDSLLLAERTGTAAINFTPWLQGNYYLILVADAGTEFAETNETNNTLVIPFIVYDNDIDLTFNLLLVSPTITKSVNANVSYQVGNTGHMNTPVLTQELSLYLSTDSIFSPSTDYFITDLGSSFTYAGLSTYSGSYFTLNIPASAPLAPGAYYMLGVVDRSNAVAETNETNNVMARPVMLQDAIYGLALSPISMYTSSNVTAGGSFKLTGSVTNDGNLTFPNAKVGYYYSTDSVLDASDILVYNSTYGSLLVGSSFGLSGLLASMPLTTPLGPAYIIAKADYSDLYTEGDEGNNTHAVAVTIVPKTVDLDIISVTITDTTDYAMGVINGYFVVKNHGNWGSSSVQYRLYISADTVFSSGDYLCGSLTSGVTVVAGGTQTVGFTNFNLNDTTGNVYLLVVADPTDVIAELDETNNTGNIALFMNPAVYDIVNSGYSLPSSFVYKGTPNTLTLNAYNNGKSRFESFDMSITLSTDTILDGSDVLLTLQNYSSISGFIPLTYYSAMAGFTIPGTVPDGIYYLIVKTDDADIYAETDEVNNYTVIRINVKNAFNDIFPNPSFYPYPELHAYPGGTVAVAVDESNIGPLAVSITNTCLLSTDTIVGSDVTVGTASSVAYVAYSTKLSSITATIPSSTAVGVYYLFWKAESGNVVPETDETNNIKIFRLYVDPKLPDLIPTQLTIPDTVIQHDYVLLKCRTSNIGNYISTSSVTAIYASTDTVLDASDALLTNVNYSGISASGAITTTVVIDTLNVVPGDYYLLLKADNAASSTESNEANNVWLYPDMLHVLPAVFDIEMNYLEANALVYKNVIEDGPTAPLTKLTFGIRNLGNARERNFRHHFYLSSDSLISSGDYTFNLNYSSTYVEGTGVRSETNSVYFTSGFPSGSYYLIDSVSSPGISETSYTNNVIRVPVILKSKYVDLGFESPTAPAASVSYGLGDHITLFGGTTKVKNYGTTPSVACDVRVYFSNDTIVDATDQHMYTYTLSTLNGNTSTGLGSHNYTIPSSLLPGRYYLLAVIDSAHVNPLEDYRKNNIYIYEFLYKGVNSDVEAYGITAGDFQINGHVDFQVSLKNNYIAASNTVLYRAYLSADTVISGSDLVLTSSFIDFPAGYDTTLDCHYTASVATGFYYIICMIDANYALTEYNEYNNKVMKRVSFSTIDGICADASSTITFDPCTSGISQYFDDGGAGNYSKPQTTLTKLITSPGQYFHLTSSVMNILPGDTLYVYNDSSYTSVLAKCSGTTPLNVITTGSYAGLFFQTGSGLPTGPGYQIGAACITPVLPNLYILSTAVDNLSAPGTYLHVNVKVKNFGTSFSSTFFTRFYISNDMSLDGSDILIGTYSFAGLSEGAVIDIVDDILLPSTLTTGDKYFIAYTDYNTLINEYLETDNQAIEPLHLGIGGINPYTEQLGFTLYPNPADGEVRIDLNGNAQMPQLIIFDAVGNQVYQTSCLSSFTVSVLNFASGVYTVALKSGNALLGQRKLVVVH